MTDREALAAFIEAAQIILLNVDRLDGLPQGKPPTPGERGVDFDGMPLDALHPWNRDREITVDDIDRHARYQLQSHDNMVAASARIGELVDRVCKIKRADPASTQSLHDAARRVAHYIGGIKQFDASLDAGRCERDLESLAEIVPALNAMPMRGAQKMLTVAEVARRKSVDQGTIRKECDKGTFAGAEKLKNRWMIPESSLANYTPTRSPEPIVKRDSFRCARCDIDCPVNRCPKCKGNALPKASAKAIGH